MEANDDSLLEENASFLSVMRPLGATIEPIGDMAVKVDAIIKFKLAPLRISSVQPSPKITHPHITRKNVTIPETKSKEWFYSTNNVTNKNASTTHFFNKLKTPNTVREPIFETENTTEHPVFAFQEVNNLILSVK